MAGEAFRHVSGQAYGGPDDGATIDGVMLDAAPHAVLMVDGHGVPRAMAPSGAIRSTGDLLEVLERALDALRGTLEGPA